MPIEVLKPGLSTTVQDRGREGYYHVGMPPSGALDQFSLVAANLLVGNPADAAALECAYMGPELRFTEPRRRRGHGRRDRAAGQRRGAAAAWTSFAVRAGDVLDVRPPQGAARGPTSRWPAASTCPRCSAAARPTRSARSAGYEGRPLQAGDELRDRRRSGDGDGRALRARGRCARTCPSELEIRVVMGLYDHLLTDDGRADVPGDDLDAHAGRRPRRLPLQGRRARHGRARAALRRGQRPVEHRRRAVPDRLDPGPRRRRADRPAPRRRLRRRLRDGRDGHQRRHGRRRPVRARARRRGSSRSTSTPRWRRGASAPTASPGSGRRSAREADGYVVISAGSQCAAARRRSIARNCSVVCGKQLAGAPVDDHAVAAHEVEHVELAVAVARGDRLRRPPPASRARSARIRARSRSVAAGVDLVLRRARRRSRCTTTP